MKNKKYSAVELSENEKWAAKCTWLPKFLIVAFR